MASAFVSRVIRGLVLFVAVSCPSPTTVAADAEIDFATHIQPILRARCYSCHGEEVCEAGLRLDVRDRALAGSDSGAVITKGDAEASVLLQRVQSTDADDRMPSEGKPLTATEIQRLQRWIEADAPWPEGIDPAEAHETHWAYQPIQQPSLPHVTNQSWAQNGIDTFILRRLESATVAPSPRADRATLVRRLYLDLHGLPPSPREWQYWTTTTDPNWYVQLVDKLLASPHYGERWARYWLDLARYADSDGYEKDEPRPHAYQWRDWVILAFNRDLPFDQFTEQQIAGDLLPGATANVKLATGFHRNTLTNREGGIDKEEDRVKQVVDRTNTVSTVWLGLTVECAQCHTHKYDPITQREYYQLYAFFNSSDEDNFQLPATKRQERDYAFALQQHQATQSQLQQRLTSIRQGIVRDLAMRESELLRSYPNGVPQPQQQHAVAHFTFDKPSFDKELLAEGRAGRGLALNVKEAHFAFTPKTPQPKHHAVTLSAWCFYEGGIGSILTKMDESADFHGIDFTVNNGKLEVHLVETWPQDAIKVTTKTEIEQNRWQQVLMRYDASRKAAGVQIFVDGKLQSLDVNTDQLEGDFVSEEPWRIGSRKAGTFFKGRLDEARIYYRALDDEEVAQLAVDPRLPKFLATAKLANPDRTAEQNVDQVDFLLSSQDEVIQTRRTLAKLQKSPPQLPHGTGVGLKQLEATRPTHVHLRGEFLSKGEEVEIGTPRFLHPLKTRAVAPDRLDFARWILSPQNTLTPRVMVNRFWQMFFGRGLVQSDRDFGSQGDPPTHPELLDWLANRFKQQSWSIKALHRQIVLSATYQQSSGARPELIERDPYNTWFAKQNRQRVDAEIVRDLALTASGLLNTRLHGPSVFPPLPPGTIELAFVDVINRGPWRPSTGGDRYRRGLYTFFQRTSAYPMLSLFDAPDSNTTCTNRERSNTPLQALTLWNDPVFMESARELARRVLLEVDSADDSGTGETAADLLQRRAKYLHVLCLSREASAGDLQDLSQLYNASLRVYEADPELKTQLLKGTVIPASVSDFEFAAWTAVARTVLNLDGFINRE